MIFWLSLAVAGISAVSLFMIGSVRARVRAWGFAVGILGQAVFATLDVLVGAYGLLLLLIVYVPLYVRGMLSQTEVLGGE